MRLRTDDEIYRVDAVWLGPPKATFLWVARYVAYAIFLPTALAVMWVERLIGIGFGLFSTAWAVILAVLITRVLGARINHERPLGAVVLLWLRELTTPRAPTKGQTAQLDPSAVSVRTYRPRPRVTRGSPARKEAPRA